jgi:hypothetical protein
VIQRLREEYEGGLKAPRLVGKHNNKNHPKNNKNEKNEKEKRKEIGESSQRKWLLSQKT